MGSGVCGPDFAKRNPKDEWSDKAGYGRAFSRALTEAAQWYLDGMPEVDVFPTTPELPVMH